MGRKFPHKSPMNIPEAKPFGDRVRLDPQDYGSSTQWLGRLRYDECLEDKGTGWCSLLPMTSPATKTQTAALQLVKRANDTIKQIESDADPSITLMAKQIGAEPIPGPPYHARGNRIERTWEYLADLLRLQLLQSHVPAYFRPLASRFVSNFLITFTKCLGKLHAKTVNPRSSTRRHLNGELTLTALAMNGLCLGRWTIFLNLVNW